MNEKAEAEVGFVYKMQVLSFCEPDCHLLHLGLVDYKKNW